MNTRILFSILVYFSLPICEMWAQNPAVVEINSFYPNGEVCQGTGFFFRDDASILTAYHVIEGASRVTVIIQNSGECHTNVKVSYISPNYDIAMIYLEDLNEVPGFINLAGLQHIPPLTESLFTIGYPRQGVQHSLITHLTTTNFINSGTIRNEKGFQIFSEYIDVLPVTLTNYVGMSGAPVVCSNGVIGLFSGSYEEGGALGWVIPRKYFGSMQAMHKKVEEVGLWPPLVLMNEQFSDVRRSSVIDTYIRNLIISFLDNIETRDNLYNEITLSSVKLYGLGTTIKLLAESRPDPNDIDSTFAYLDDQLPEYLEKFASSITLWSENSISLAENLSDILSWYQNESQMTHEEKETFERKIWQNSSIQYNKLNDKSYMEAIGVSENSVADFFNQVSGLFRPITYEEKISFRIIFAEAVLDWVRPYMTPESISYSSNEISMYRKWGKTIVEHIYH